MLLAIDTSQMTYSIAFSNRDEITWDDIHLTIYDQLQNIDLNDLEGIIVNIGPGRFSGLRSGLAFAQGLALAKNLPIYPITQFELIASMIEDTDFNIILDARKSEVYMQHYHMGKAVSDITITNNTHTSGNLYGNIHPAKVIDTSAKDLINYFKKHTIAAIKAHELSPIYIRPSV